MQKNKLSSLSTSGRDVAVIGIDLSLTATGIVVVSGKEPGQFVGKTIGYKLKEPMLAEKIMRLDKVVTEIIDFVMQSSTKYIVVEDIAYGVRGNRVLDLAGLFWTLMVELYRRGLAPEVVQCRAARKLLFGKGGGGLKKKQIMVVMRKIGYVFADDNQMDAWIVANWYRDKLGLSAIKKGVQFALFE